MYDIGDVGVFLGLDVGKSAHDGHGLTPAGKKFSTGTDYRSDRGPTNCFGAEGGVHVLEVPPCRARYAGVALESTPRVRLPRTPRSMAFVRYERLSRPSTAPPPR